VDVSSEAVSDEYRAQWDLYWTSRGAVIPHGFLPLLDEWRDVDVRERQLGIEDRTPILIDPQGRIDPRLAAFFRRSRFARLALGSRQSYAKDYRLFFSFLSARGRHWDEADPDDMDDYEAWRRRSSDNPSRIGGAKWQRELAAFKLLYDWAEGHGHVRRSPIVMLTVRARDGSVVEVAANSAKDVRSANVKWVTPRTFRLWLDIGLRGYSGDGLPEKGWRGRNGGRNAAFAELLFESGLRLREGGCLLTIEVPDAVWGQSYYEGTVAAAIAKRRERMFYVHDGAVKAVTAYMATSRRAAIRRAQRRGAYEQMPHKRVVTNLTLGQTRTLIWEDAVGNRGESSISTVNAEERRRLFIHGPTGLEPLQLWLTESGMPMCYESWEKVFDAANQRCHRRGKPISLSPHVCRHSFALKMLIALQRGLDERFGLDPNERKHLRDVFGGAFPLVRDLLGHQSEDTTRTIYLEPVSGIRLAQILDGTEDLPGILARAASSSRLVMDIAPDPDDA
jgi:site-specific recombinase XerD